MQTMNQYAKKDAELFDAVRRLQAGDGSGTNQVYELSEKYIYKIINDIVKNHQTTEDLMQETYMQVYNKIDSLQSPEAFYVWAGRIATNLTLRYIQKYRKEVLAVADEEGNTDFIFETAGEDTEEFLPETVLDNKETQRLIADIIDNLSIEQKLSIQYFYYEEMSVRDIAAVMGCSEGTVKSRLNYARKSIKNAVIDLDVKQGVRLYSLASMPVFLLIFRAGVEQLAIGAGMAAAGAAGVGTAQAMGGSVGAAGAGTAQAMGGSVGAAGTGTAQAMGGSVGAASAGTAQAMGGSVGAAGTGTAQAMGGSVGAASAGTGATAASAGTGTAGAIGSAGIGTAGSMGTAAGVGVETAATAGTGTAGSTGAAAGKAAGIGAKIFGTTTGKAAVGVLAAAVVATGGTAAVNRQPAASQKAEVSTASADALSVSIRYCGEMAQGGYGAISYSDKDMYISAKEQDRENQGGVDELRFEDALPQEIQEMFNNVDGQAESLWMECRDEYLTEYIEDLKNTGWHNGATISFRGNDGEFERDVKEWFPSEVVFSLDGKSYTFHVRGAKFSIQAGSTDMGMDDDPEAWRGDIYYKEITNPETGEAAIAYTGGYHINLYGSCEISEEDFNASYYAYDEYATDSEYGKMYDGIYVNRASGLSASQQTAQGYESISLETYAPDHYSEKIPKVKKNDAPTAQSAVEQPVQSEPAQLQSQSQQEPQNTGYDNRAYLEKHIGRNAKFAPGNSITLEFADGTSQDFWPEDFWNHDWNAYPEITGYSALLMGSTDENGNTTYKPIFG